MEDWKYGESCTAWRETNNGKINFFRKLILSLFVPFQTMQLSSETCISSVYFKIFAISFKMGQVVVYFVIASW